MREWNNSDKHRGVVIVGGAAALGDELIIDEVDRDFSIVGMSPPRLKRVTSAGTDVFSVFLGEAHDVFRARAKFATQVAIENLGDLECASVAEVVTKMVGYIRYIFGNFARLHPEIGG